MGQVREQNAFFRLSGSIRCLENWLKLVINYLWCPVWKGEVVGDWKRTVMV